MLSALCKRSATESVFLAAIPATAAAPLSSLCALLAAAAVFLESATCFAVMRGFGAFFFFHRATRFFIADSILPATLLFFFAAFFAVFFAVFFTTFFFDALPMLAACCRFFKMAWALATIACARATALSAFIAPAWIFFFFFP